MEKASFKFELGKFKCQVVMDGDIPPQFGGLPINCLYVQTGKHNVLVDTGEGPTSHPTTGFLIQNLKYNGIKPEEIDTVIITHAHIDHMGGNTDGQGKIFYPNARFYVLKTEWDYWLSRLKLKPEEQIPAEAPHIQYVRRSMVNIADRFTLLGDNDEIIPGFQFSKVPGHTPGNAMIVITSGKEQLLFVGDLLHEVAEFSKPDMWAQWDTNPEESIRTRAEMIARAVETHALVFINHFIFPGLGYIIKKGDTLDWEPYKK
jgi:glyoxylase-like metal-dependent hydrolase (beta-lactamase superfamily II)